MQKNKNDSYEADRKFVIYVCDLLKMTPSAIMTKAGGAATTLNRYTSETIQPKSHLTAKTIKKIADAHGLDYKHLLSVYHEFGAEDGQKSNAIKDTMMGFVDLAFEGKTEEMRERLTEKLGMWAEGFRAHAKTDPTAREMVNQIRRMRADLAKEKKDLKR